MWEGVHDGRWIKRLNEARVKMEWGIIEWNKAGVEAEGLRSHGPWGGNRGAIGHLAGQGGRGLRWRYGC